MDRTASRRQAGFAARKREQGLRPVTLWVPEEGKAPLRQIAAALASGELKPESLAALLSGQKTPKRRARPASSPAGTLAPTADRTLRDPVGRVTEIDRQRGRDPHDTLTPELPLGAST
ncbi:hypothetical protein [Azospirillum sp. sgz302134]